MRKRLLIFSDILFLLLACMPVIAPGQTTDFSIRLLDERNGIRTSNIRRVVRDKSGFLWILSPRYLQRFDGQEVRLLDVKGEDLLDIAADHSGDVWVSTQSGVRLYINDHAGFRDIPVETGHATKLNLLQVASDNSVWIISGTGLFRLDRSAMRFKPHPLPGYEKQLFYRRLFARHGDEFFIGDTHTIFAYNPLRGTLRQIPFEAASVITAVSEHVIWVTDIRKQVFEVNFSTGRKRALSPDRFQPGLSSPFLEIIGTLPLDAVTALVSTSQGCFRYHSGQDTFEKITTFYYGAGFPLDEVSASYFDDSGTLWLVSQQGILFLRPLEHSFHWLKDAGRKEGGGNNFIYAITGDDSGNIWLGTATGLVKFDPRNGKGEMRYPQGNRPGEEVNHSVRGLSFDGRYVIFGAYSGGIQLYDPVHNRIHKPAYPAGKEGEDLKSAIERDHIYRIHKLNNGNHLVLGDLGCYLLSGYRLSRLKFSGSDYILQAAAETSSGHLWLGSYKGLLFLGPDFKPLLADTLFSPNRLVSAVALQNDSIVWAGSVGLYEVSLDAGRLSRKPVLPELKNQQITNIFKDPAGKLWIGTDNGLYRYAPDTRKLEWFDIWDNVQNKQLNPGSFYYGQNGLLYLGGNSGLNYFDPLRIDPREEPLNVMITEVRVNRDDSLFLTENPRTGRQGALPGDTLAQPAKPLQLAWDQNSVEIHFSTPYFRNPKKLRYRYRMEGLDSNWVSSGSNNTVRFSSLAPGRYTFSVATSPDGIRWYETAAPFRFQISPPVWQRTWFIALALVVTIGGSYWLVKRRIAGIKRQESRVYALQNRTHSLEKEKALAMYEGLKQQLNPHFLFNSLTSLSSLIRIDQKLAGEFLDGLSKTYRYILKNRDHELVPLGSEIRFAKTFVKLQKTRFEEGLEVHFKTGEEAETLLVAPVTLQNLIENAIKHNIIAPDSPLIIEILVEDGYLLVRNNKQKKNFVETSNKQGLANLKSLYQYLSGDPLTIIDAPSFFTVKIPLIVK
ncbi:MAG: hypothetical protein ABS46_00300 [Cytophagaceae bacterium SCN 52-12]|nr:MAG: hypothetical protein ABS46_00300 [Cytophagaceae bacterium SCN 52-12]